MSDTEDDEVITDSDLQGLKDDGILLEPEPGKYVLTLFGCGRAAGLVGQDREAAWEKTTASKKPTKKDREEFDRGYDEATPSEGAKAFFHQLKGH